VDGTGGQRGDYLLQTNAHVKFTVFVEIKKPDSPLLETREYRNGVYQVGKELTGGIAQIQSNSLTWETEGSRTDTNRDALDALTCRPKGILIIGNTSQLDDRNKKLSFELFRRNISNPEIVTYDELLAKAQFIISHQVEEREVE